MVALKISHKVIKGATRTKRDAQKKKRKLQRESPNAAFRIFGNRKNGYRIYQVWYCQWNCKNPVM